MATVFFALLGVVAVAAFAYWFWARATARDIAESASQKWTQLQSADPDLIAGIDEAGFRKAFHRTHFPRFPKYALAMLAAFIVASPAALAALAGIALSLEAIGWSSADRLARSVPVLGAADAVSRDGGETIALYYVQDFVKFYYYFGVVFVWLAIVYVAMRRFHRRRPGYLQEEILKQKAED